MQASLDCIQCILKKAAADYDRHETDKAKKKIFMKKVYRMIGECSDDVTAPYLTKNINSIMREEFGDHDDYTLFKTEFNKIMLRKEPHIWQTIHSCKDPLLAGLQYAMVGNYIDMHAVSDIDEDKIDHILSTAPHQVIAPAIYEAFLNDLRHSKRLVYLHDNAGEIVMDKLFLNIIQTQYPNILLTSIVRGKPVINDATLQDAEITGLCDVVNVIGNGTDIPGTQLDDISVEALDAIRQADLILSKGQGNFETLHGCDRNIYYLFLCKCDLFVKRFGLARFTGVFANERNLPVYEE